MYGELACSDYVNASAILTDEEFQVSRMRLVCDYVAGMTDGYALKFHSWLIFVNPAVLFTPI